MVYVIFVLFNESITLSSKLYFNVVALNGLDGYCLPKLVDRFQYARKETPTASFYKK